MSTHVRSSIYSTFKHISTNLMLINKPFSKYLNTIYTPAKQPDAQLLVEREKQIECRLIEISRS